MMICPKDGTFYFRKELILKLLDEQYQVILVGPYGSKVDYFTEKGCKFVNIPIDRRGKSVIKDIKLFLDYYKTIKKEKPDIVLTYTTKCSVYGGLACSILKRPYIVNNAGLIISQKKGILDILLTCLYYIGFKKSSCMMYQNSYERDTINKLLNYRVYFKDIPGSGVNLEKFTAQPYPDSDEKIFFNFVGRIVSIKGINEMLDCAEIIKKRYPNVFFRIYGSYDEDKYRDRIELLNQEGVIEYKGLVEDMLPEIASAHAVIHPSYYEGMTNVVLEHGAGGRPSLGSKIPGVADAIIEGETGFTFEPRNSEALVNCVEKFINLPYEKKFQMGESARQLIEKKFNRRIVTNIYLDEINRIINKQKMS